MRKPDESCVDDRDGLVTGGVRPRCKFVLGHDDRLHRVPSTFDRFADALPPFADEGPDPAAGGVGVASWLGAMARVLPSLGRA